jgi:phospholipase C
LFNYYWSFIGPTMPNRLYWLSGNIDPNGRNGGPVVDTPGISQVPRPGARATGTRCPRCSSTTASRGRSTKRPAPPPAAQKLAPSSSFNALSFFRQYVTDPTGPLSQQAFEPVWPDDFKADVQSGQLPSVSWVLPPLPYSEHPSNDPQVGEWFISQVLSTVMSNRELWSKTVVFLTYDENGGFFDHVIPPTAPPGTADETLTVTPSIGEGGGFTHPTGLGFRVPALVISPWSRGGYVDPTTFDHTSMLRFLETRFGVKAPNVSAWRRRTVGDMTSTLDFKQTNNGSPALPATSMTFQPGCPTPQNISPFFGPPEPIMVPIHQQQPTQEPGSARTRE